MLDSIRIRSCGAFDGEGVSFEGLKRVNVIFGANGTGKTTVSKALADPVEAGASCELEWDAGGVQSVRVLNRDFRESCVRATDIPGIYTVGEENAEAVARIDELKMQIGEMNAQVADEQEWETDCRTELGRLWEDFKEDVWALKAGRKSSGVRGYYDVFKPAFKGFAQKESFAKRLVEARKAGVASCRTEAELLEDAAVLFADEQLERADAMEDVADQVARLAETVGRLAGDALWGRPVVGNADLPIARLISELGCADWVRAGTEYLRGDGVCPFCQQSTVDADLATQIERFFDGAYRADVERMEELKGRIIAARDVAGNLALRAGDSGDACPHVDFEGVRTAAEALATALELCEERAAAKLAEPGRRVEMPDVDAVANRLVEELAALTEAAGKYNETLLSRSAATEALIGDIWDFFACSAAVRIDAYRASAADAHRRAQGHAKSARGLRDAIEAAQAEMAEQALRTATVADAARRMNRLLAACGAQGFSVVESSRKPGCYEVVRADGSAAGAGLSEGEEALLAFAYFLQLAYGARDAADVGRSFVAVVDDPATGLDAEVRERVRQLLCRLASEAESDADAATGAGTVAGASGISQLIFLSHDADLCSAVRAAADDPACWILVKEAGITHLGTR